MTWQQTLLDCGVFAAGFGLFLYAIALLQSGKQPRQPKEPTNYLVTTTTGYDMEVIGYDITWEGDWIGFTNAEGVYYRLFPAHRISEVRCLSASFPIREAEGVTSA